MRQKPQANGKHHRLSDDDQRVWLALQQSITPLVKKEAVRAPALRPGHVAVRYHQTPPLPPAAGETQPWTIGDVRGMDANNAQRLKSGVLRPEARLDLHGHTLVAAHGKLCRFIDAARQQGLRRLLIITGKGRPEQPGAIREALPGWLGASNIRPFVVAITEATPKDGGSGAFYVLLRRARS